MKVLKSWFLLVSSLTMFAATLFYPASSRGQDPLECTAYWTDKQKTTIRVNVSNCWYVGTEGDCSKELKLYFTGNAKDRPIIFSKPATCDLKLMSDCGHQFTATPIAGETGCRVEAVENGKVVGSCAEPFLDKDTCVVCVPATSDEGRLFLIGFILIIGVIFLLFKKGRVPAKPL